MRAKAIAFVMFAAAGVLGVEPATHALAASVPMWHVALVPMPTNFAPGSIGNEFEAPLFRLVATNIGDGPTSGPISLDVNLPAGVKAIDPVGDGSAGSSSPAPSCGVDASGEVVSCTSTKLVYPGRWLGARIPVEVIGAPGALEAAEATVSGGGAEAVSTSYATEIANDPPSFGFLKGTTGLNSLLTRPEGGAETQAGSHPDQLTVSFSFPTSQPLGFGPVNSAGHLRDLITDLPKGLVANPQATAVRCTEAELLSGSGDEPGCPLASQVGTIAAMTEVAGPSVAVSALYNMVPSPGTAGQLAFNAVNAGIFVHVAGSVRSDGDYGLSAAARDIIARPNNPILSAQSQIWGDPSGSSHDEIRGGCRGSLVLDFCPVSADEHTNLPFLTMPSACSGPLTTGARIDSWEDPGVFVPGSAQSTDLLGNPVGVNGCSALEFEPTLTVQPEQSAAETPTGLQVRLEVSQSEELFDDEGKRQLATSNVKDTTVSFPAGMALNPAAAGGLGACTPAQVGMTTGVGVTPPSFSAAPTQCPANSKIGTIEVTTPVLDHSLPGSVYVAQPYQNPFGTLLGVYIVIEAPEDGVFAKLAGKTEADPVTG
jgi:hypothetical protein